MGATSSEIKYSDDTSSVFGFDPTLDNIFEASDVGTKTITITYHSKQTTFNVNVLENNKFVIYMDCTIFLGKERADGMF